MCLTNDILCALFHPTPSRSAARYHSQGFNLRSLKHLVLDEADRMLSMDFEEELNKVRERKSTKKGESSNIANRQSLSPPLMSPPVAGSTQKNVTMCNLSPSAAPHVT